MEFVGVGNRKNSQGYKYFPERKDINKIFLFFFFFFPGPEGKQSNNKRFLNVFYWYLLVTILLVF